ncbi:hypothetical protein I3843_13G038100 [Carya illinoinensis]|nr:hypothetical protein I3843_13G038100 [Carya illinoinensis]
MTWTKPMQPKRNSLIHKKTHENSMTQSQRGTACDMYKMDFQPRSERKEEAAENIIIVHLPGFTKQRIKVTYVNRSRTVTARGEQPVVNDRWSRFNLSFPVPNNCDTDKIRAKFQHGVLSITIPKKIVARVGPAEEAKTTQKTPSLPKSVSQSKSQNVQKGIIPPMPASTSGVEKMRREEIARPQSLKRVATERKVENGREDIPPQATSSNAIDERKWVKTNQSRSPPEATTEPNAQKGQDLAPPKATSTSDTRNVTGKASMASSAEKEQMIGKELADLKAEKGINVRIKTVMDSAKQRVNSLAKRRINNEDKRQSLVKIGVAVLVIVALGVGAYLSYISHRSRDLEVHPD